MKGIFKYFSTDFYKRQFNILSFHGIDYFEIYGIIILNDYVLTQRSFTKI